MAYTQAQLTTAFTNAAIGTTPSAAQNLTLQAIATQNASGQLTDAQALSQTINLAANGTTDVSVGAYQFFVGTAPSVAGLTSLNAAYTTGGAQAGLNGENRFIAESVALATQNTAAKAAFTASYGSLTVAQATAAAYNIIIGNPAAVAAGVDVTAAVNFLSSAASVAYYTAFIKANTSLTAQADIDLAVKAAIVGEIMYIADSYNNGSGLGSYATATNTLVSDLADDGKLTADNAAGVDLFANYGTAAPGATQALTINQDTLVGSSNGDTFTAGIILDNAGNPISSLQNFDAINGGAGVDTLNVTVNAGTVVPSLTSVEVVNVRATGAATVDLSASTGVNLVNVAGSSAVATILSAGAAGIGVANQNQNVVISGSTATALTLNLDTVGTAATDIGVNLGSVVANAATSFAITAKDAHVTFTETQAGVATTSASVAATGANEITFTAADAASLATVSVTGAGSVDFSGVALTALKTLTVADGGVTVDTTGGILETVTTGAGADVVTSVGTTVKTFSTGAGNDKVTFTTALAATGVVDLGAGDDTVTLNATPTAGATLTGGAGTDTIAVAAATYTAISGFTAPNLAKITGFETLKITNALVNASTTDVSKIAGVVNFVAGAGVAAAGAASVTGLGAGSTVEIQGAVTTGTLTASLATDTAADTLNLKFNTTYTENNDGTSTVQANTQAQVTTSLIETVNVISTGTASTPFLGGTGTKADAVKNTLVLVDNDLVTLNVTGNSALAYSSAAGQTKLATVDGSALTAGLTFSGAAADMTTPTTSVAMTIKGSLTAANTLTGTGHADTIIGGAKADSITGGAGGDTLTGNGGNDKFVLIAGDSTIAAGNADTITDFAANTAGLGTGGAPTAAGADTANLTGDTLSFTHLTTNNNGVTFGVYTNAADASTFLQTQSATEGAAANQTVHTALDSSTGNLYVDLDGNGTADTYIHLTGVTTLTTAAFIIT